MIISEKAAEERLQSPENLVNRFRKPEESSSKETSLTVVPISNIRRGPEVPKVVKNTIAILAHGDKQTDLANEFGVPQPSVSGYKNGKQGADADAIQEAIKPVRERALDRLMASLNLLNDDKLSNSTAKDLSTIAANMGRVVEKTLPKESIGSGLNVVIYAPQIRAEREYKVIEA